MKKTTNQTTTTTNQSIVSVYADNFKSIHDMLPKSVNEFVTINLENVVIEPLRFKNAVTLDVMRDMTNNLENEVDAFKLKMRNAEKLIKKYEMDKKVGTVATYSEKDIKKVNDAVKFLVDADDKLYKLQSKYDAYKKALSSVPESYLKYCDTLKKECADKMGVTLMNWLLLRSLCSGDVSTLSNIFKPVLEKASSYLTLKASENSTSDDCTASYKAYEVEAKNLFELFSVTDANPIFSKRTISMNNKEFNNMARLIAGLKVEMKDGYLKMTTVSYGKFKDVLVRVLIMKKQNIKLVF